MKAKEKAQELAEKMFGVDLNCPNEDMCMLYPHAIKCAILAVEELLNQSWDYRTLDNSVSYNSWLEVKKELEKL